ncbi:hypothetical protein, partial [Microcoleus sp. OTE_8_concoct_300]|uniref:hypothetical protein n=1 Tax=Microcoleus sp. OTE_8_concoct_300 TaxID=2964710 RepID=UPI00403F0ACE
FTKPVTSTYIQANALRFWRLEPDDGKLSSPVLRGGGRGDVFLLTRQKLNPPNPGSAWGFGG